MGVATPSPILQDIRLKQINLSSANYIIGAFNSSLPNAQALSKMLNGYVYNTGGIVSTVSTIPIVDLPNLPVGNIWIGDINNRPVASPTIALNNLPDLTKGNMWIGDISGRPIEIIAPPGPQGPAGPPGPRGLQGVQGPTGLSFKDVLKAIFEALLKKIFGDNLVLDTLKFLTGATFDVLFDIWLNGLKAALAGAAGRAGALGEIGVTGIIGSTGRSAANTLIIRNVNIDLSGNRIFNLAQSPAWDYDVITAKFFYDLLNNNVIILWKQNIWTSMAMSTITVEGINPTLNILGATQQFNFNQSLSTFQLTNINIPTSLIPSQTNYEYRNNILSGFRWYHVTSNTDTYGSLTLQSFVNALPTGTDIIKFNSSGIGLYSNVNLNTNAITNGIWQGSPIGLGYGGTNANLTASNGGIFYSTATAGAILAGTATANQMLLSGSNSAPSWSTTTYPATTTINQLLYSSANNVIVGLATANNGVLVTSSGGVPSIGPTLPSAVQGNITSLGTIGSGTWNGTAVTVPYGGTGLASTMAYSVICGGTTSTGALQSVASVGTSGQVLTSQGASALPIWANTVTSITAGTGLSGGTITSSGTIAIENTTVTAGNYIAANITVNAQGQLTSATSSAISTGSAATCGIGILNGTTGVTINTTAISTTSIVNITRNNGTSGAPLASSLGELSVGSISSGTSFIVYSSNMLDTFGFSWQIVNPA